VRLVKTSNLRILSWDLRDVPWQFQSEREGGLFIQRIHDACCDPAYCWREACRYLGSTDAGHGGILLNWTLFVMTAQKPKN